MRNIRCILFSLSIVIFPCQVFAQNNLDERILLEVYDNYGNKTFDRIMRTAEQSSVPVFIGVPAIASGIAIFKPSYRQDAYNLGLSYMASIGTMTLLKKGFRRLRPYQNMEQVEYQHGEKTPPDVDSFSFPSGHGTASFSLATSLTLQSKKWYVAVPAYTYAGAVALSRVYDAKHYPSDILIGAVVGTGVTLLVHRYQDKLTPAFLKQGSNDNTLRIAPQGIGFRILKQF